MVAQIFLALALVTVPVVLAVIAMTGGKGGGLMYLLFPVIGAAPAVAAAVLLFAPAEAALDGHGLGQWKNAAVPLIGSLLVWLVLLPALLRDPRRVIQRLGGAGAGNRVAILLWMGLGALWGATWRVARAMVA
jgi:hypothetical protein